jgi:hypothetical protein
MYSVYQYFDLGLVLQTAAVTTTSFFACFYGLLLLLLLFLNAFRCLLTNNIQGAALGLWWEINLGAVGCVVEHLLR